MKFFKLITSDPNVIGEHLRDEFFDGERGCYYTFDLKNDVTELPNELVDSEDDSLEYNVSQKNINNENIVMKYYWDGDGCLEFHWSDGTVLINTDCKKDHGWRFTDINDWRYKNNWNTIITT